MDPAKELKLYDVVFDSPGLTDRSSMPLGNGEIGVNVWTTEDGALEMYLSRSDAFDWLGRNKKLGKFRLELGQNFFAPGPFCQKLLLEKGCVEITAGAPGKQLFLQVFAEKSGPRVYIRGRCEQPVRPVLHYFNWRCLPENPEIYDEIFCRDDKLVFYYRDGKTSVPDTAALEGLAEETGIIFDPFRDRVFGGAVRMTGACPRKTGQARGQLCCAEPCREFEAVICTDSDQRNLQPWLEDLCRNTDSSAPGASAAEETAAWWHRYWQNSWVFVRGDEPAAPSVDPALRELEIEPRTWNGQGCPLPPGASAVTRAYVLTKYMFACNAEGRMPMYFNGLLFNTMPGENSGYDFRRFAQIHTGRPLTEPTAEVNPDCRCWSCNVLWQNVRLLYYSMLERNEWAWVRRLFAFYRRFWDLNRARAWLYYGAEGQHNTEITMFSGLQHPWIYGEDRDGKPLGYSLNRWGGAVDISPGLELACFMLEYVRHTGDTAFLQEEALVYARDLLRYIETRFPARKKGKIVIEPLNCVETFWDTRDPITVTAGMRALLEAILDLPGELVGDRPYFEQMLALTPELPLEKDEEGEPVLAPAAVYRKDENNVEAVALYAVYPFRCQTWDRQNHQPALRYYTAMKKARGAGFKPRTIGEGPSVFSYSGWQYIGSAAALLGQTGDAAKILSENAVLSNPGYRFPAMWGPVYDGVPDADHGGNILHQTQLMLMQTRGKTIRLFPAWPARWDVSFRLYADGQTTVTCELEKGKIKNLAVSPPERRADVVLPSWC